MSYERTCGECSSADQCEGPFIDVDPDGPCCHWEQRPATTGELRKELLDQAEASTAMASMSTHPDWSSRLDLRTPGGLVYRFVPCLRRIGDEGIE
jgi:hypothetical protein